MSEPINANPTVLEISDLPTRRVDQSKETNFKENNGISDWGRIAGGNSGNIFNIDDNDDEYYSLISRATSPGLISDSSSNSDDDDDDNRDIIDPQEIYDLISTISDPEHPLTLGQLAVVQLNDIRVKDNNNSKNNLLSYVYVDITPTITHCSLATLIGLGIRVRLERSLSPRFRIQINVKQGTHQSQDQVNRQLNDKERVAAACENQQLVGVIENMLATCK